MEKGKLILVDAYAFIYRAYYAYLKSPRITSKGQNVSAIFGFIQTLDSVLKAECPTHIGVAFDTAKPTFRHEIYPQYKAHRDATPEDIHNAVPYIKRILEAYHIPVLEMPGYEADDVIGTLALQAAADGYTTLMMTPDKDYGQLVGERCFIYKPRFGSNGFDLVGVNEINKKYGISSPCQIIDLLGLWGDSSDNIPGCPGVGEKRAKELISQFGSIENMLENIGDIKGALQDKVRDNAEQIRFSKFLATIKIDVPVHFDPDRLILQSPDKEALRAIYTELEFRSLIERMYPKSTVSAASPIASSPKQLDIFETEDGKVPPQQAASTEAPQISPATHHLITNLAEHPDVVAAIGAADKCVINIETTNKDPQTAELIGITVNLAENTYYFPVDLREDLFNANREHSLSVMSMLKPILEDTNITKIGHDIKFTIVVLTRYGISLSGKLIDTMIAHYLIQPERQHGLLQLIELYSLPYSSMDLEATIPRERRSVQQTLRDLDVNAVADFACNKASAIWALWDILQRELKKLNMGELFEQIEMSLLPVLAEMEIGGVLLDRQSLQVINVVYNKRLATLEREIYDLAGVDFNISSPRQVGELLFDKLAISDNVKKTKSGQYVTDEETLLKYIDTHPIVEKIIAHRGLKKLLGTYIEALPKLINPNTGHIHTSFNQSVTVTGRLSSSNPNLQNIPVRDDNGREIRKAFFPDNPQSLFLSADYSQIELRIMAHLSGDANMIEAFMSGEDIHAATAAKVFGVPMNEVTREMRRQAKVANFGIIYGISTYGFAERLKVSRTEAKELIENYFITYPLVKEYMNKSIEVAREKGYVETLLRRRRYLPDILSPSALVRAYAERNAINAPIQGTAADIIKIAMIRIAARLRREKLKTRMLLQVHDELTFSVPQDEQLAAETIVLEEMNNAYPMRVPLIADAGWGRNWLEAH